MASSGSPAHIMQIAMGFAPSRALQVAVQLDLFGILERNPEGLTATQIAELAGLPTDDPANRGTADFLDLLLSVGCLQREGDGPDAKYSNTPDGSEFLVHGKQNCVAGFIAMAHERMYPAYGGLLGALKTGEAVRLGEHSDADPFDEMVKSGFVETFALSMAGLSNGHNMVFAKKFDFSGYATLADIGGSTGNLCVRVAEAAPHMRCATYDRRELEPIAAKYIKAHGVEDRVSAGSLNFFEERFPTVDVITMGYILHDWGLPNKLMLMKKAYDALPEGGAFVALDATIDEARRTAAGQLSISLTMLVEFGKENASDYTYPEFKEWAAQVGFARTEFMELVGLAGACIAYK